MQTMTNGSGHKTHITNAQGVPVPDFADRLQTYLTRGQRETFVVQEAIGPYEAETLKKLNTANFRKERKQQTAMYVRDMRAGNWTLSDPISVSAGGVLINGQHRLSAVIKSGVTIPVMLAFGMPLAAAKHFDQPLVRTQAQVLDLPPKTVAVVRAVARIRDGLPAAYKGMTVDEVGEAAMNLSAELSALQTYYQQDFAACMWGAVAAVFYKNPGSVTDFARTLIEGAQPGTTAHTLRDYLLRTKVVSGGNSGGRESTVATTQKTLYALRSHLSGGPAITKLQSRDDTSIVVAWANSGVK